MEILARECADSYNFVVSEWGYNDSEVTFWRPGDALKKIGRFLSSPKNRIKQENGVYYVGNPYLNISSKIPYLGHFDRLLNVHRKNIECATSELGSIDLVHAHVSFPGGYLAYLLNKELDIPYILTEHMGPYPFDRYTLDGKPIPEIHQAMNQAAKIVAVSEALASQIRSFHEVDPVVIPNMVDEELFAPEIIAKDDTSFRFFTLSAMERAKGIEDLLRAIALWKPSSSNIHFLIGGEGAEREEFMNLSKALETEKYISWLGRLERKEIPGYLNACNAFVLPSHIESFGIVYAEAIACGKPVIATTCGGPEMIVNEINGKLVPVKDSVALAETLKWMAKNGKSYDPEKIRNDFMNRFSKKAVSKKLIDLYNTILIGEKVIY